MTGRSLPLAASVGAVALLAAGVRLATRPPPVPTGDAAPEVFHADRALDALTDALGPLEPRPPGTEAHARARDGLVAALEALGAEVEVQDELLPVGETHLARVRNVVGRLRGEGKGPARVLAAHYDSVPAGPGAADDGSGVAVALEVARAVRAGPPLAHDLLVVLTDAEELGLWGARAFVAAKERWGPLGAVVNVEARGAGGPSLVFEVGPGVEPLLASLARPQATSVAAEVYRRMPNDTDFTVFREAGLTGFNLAFIEDWPAYHAPFDTLDRLDRRSVQHHGENALALVRALDGATLPGDKPAAPEPAEPVAFTDLLGRWMLLLPTRWLAGMGALGTIAALVPVMRRRVGAAAVGGALARHVLALATGLVLACVPGLVLTRVTPDGGPWHPYGGLVVATALALGALGPTLALRPAVARGEAGDPCRTALPVAWALLVAAGGAALGEVAPGAAHLLVLPGLALGILASLGARPLVATLGAVATGVLLLPLAWTLPDVVGVRLPAAAVLPILLTLAPLAPLVRGLPLGAWRWLAGGLALTGVAGCLALAALPPFDSAAPGTTVARVDDRGVTLVGQGRTGEVVGVTGPELAALLPAPHVACARVGADWEVEILPPRGGLDLAVELAGPARLGWGPHEGELVAGAWVLTGVGPEGVRLSLPGGELAPLPVRVIQRGVLVDAVGVDRGAAQAPRGPGDRATWAGEIQCPSGEAGPLPTVRPGSVRPPSSPRARRRG